MTKDQRKIYDEWSTLVNMTPAQLRAFLRQYGQVAGLSREEAAKQGIRSGRDSARKILAMQDKGVRRWTDQDWVEAKAQINFLKRMTGLSGPLRDDDGEPTRKLLALMVWGHDPEKTMRKNHFEDFVGEVEALCRKAGFSCGSAKEVGNRAGDQGVEFDERVRLIHTPSHDYAVCVRDGDEWKVHKRTGELTHALGEVFEQLGQARLRGNGRFRGRVIDAIEGAVRPGEMVPVGVVHARSGLRVTDLHDEIDELSTEGLVRVEADGPYREDVQRVGLAQALRGNRGSAADQAKAALDRVFPGGFFDVPGENWIVFVYDGRGALVGEFVEDEIGVLEVSDPLGRRLGTVDSIEDGIELLRNVTPRPNVAGQDSKLARRIEDVLFKLSRSDVQVRAAGDGLVIVDVPEGGRDVPYVAISGPVRGPFDLEFGLSEYRHTHGGLERTDRPQRMTSVERTREMFLDTALDRAVRWLDAKRVLRPQLGLRLNARRKKMTPDELERRVIQAYVDARTSGGFRNVAVSELVERSGLSASAVHGVLDALLIGGFLNPTRGDATAASPEELAAAYDVDGEPHVFVEVYVDSYQGRRGAPVFRPRRNGTEWFDIQEGQTGAAPMDPLAAEVAGVLGEIWKGRDRHRLSVSYNYPQYEDEMVGFSPAHPGDVDRVADIGRVPGGDGYVVDTGYDADEPDVEQAVVATVAEAVRAAGEWVLRGQRPAGVRANRGADLEEEVADLFAGHGYAGIAVHEPERGMVVMINAPGMAPAAGAIRRGRSGWLTSYYNHDGIDVVYEGFDLDEAVMTLGRAFEEGGIRDNGRCRRPGLSRGDFLLPAERKYPAPDRDCVLTALTYASWPNNLADAPKVLAAVERSKWASDPAVREAIDNLRAKM